MCCVYNNVLKCNCSSICVCGDECDKDVCVTSVVDVCRHSGVTNIFEIDDNVVRSFMAHPTVVKDVVSYVR